VLIKSDKLKSKNDFIIPVLGKRRATVLYKGKPIIKSLYPFIGERTEICEDAFVKWSNNGSTWVNCPAGWLCNEMQSKFQWIRRACSKECPMSSSEIHNNEQILDYLKIFEGENGVIKGLNKNLIIREPKVEQPEVICDLIVGIDGELKKVDAKKYKPGSDVKIPEINEKQPDKKVKKKKDRPEIKVSTLDELKGLNLVDFHNENDAKRFIGVTKHLLDNYEVHNSNDELLRDLKIKQIIEMPLDLIIFNPFNPRRYIDPLELVILAISIKQVGDASVPVHLTIRKNKTIGFYPYTVDGERRCRAAKLAGLTHITAMIREDMDDAKLHFESTKANCGQQRMSPIEEALAIVKIQNDYGFTINQVSDNLGITVSTINNFLKYLKLNDAMQDLLMKKQITKGEALAISPYKHDSQQKCLELITIATEEAGGRKLTGGEYNRVLTKYAELGKVHRQHSERHRKPMPYAEQVYKKFLKTITSFESLVNEFGAMNDGLMTDGKKETRQKVLNELIQMQEKIADVVARIRRVG